MLGMVRYGQARLGGARKPVVRCGAIILIPIFIPAQGSARQCWPKLGMARPGSARPGNAWQCAVGLGEESCSPLQEQLSNPNIQYLAQHGAARPGKAGRGQAGQCTARLSVAWPGKESCSPLQVELNIQETYMATNQYPIDFSALYKGQLLSPEFLEEAVGVSRREDYKLYKFQVLKIQETIHATTTFTAKFENDGLRILTDGWASAYGRRRWENVMAEAGRIVGRMQNVDSANLTSFERAQHDRHLLVTGSCMLAIKDTKKKFIIGNSRKPKEIAEPVKINQSDENEKEQVQ